MGLKRFILVVALIALLPQCTTNPDLAKPWTFGVGNQATSADEDDE